MNCPNTIGLVGQVGHWSTSNGHLLRSWDAHPDALYALALSPDGELLFMANANNNNVAVFDVSTRGKSRSLGFIPVGW